MAGGAPDFVLSGARVAGHPGPVDIAVAEGRIAAIGPAVPGDRRTEADGAWVFPGYVDAHLHLDKAHKLTDEFTRLFDSLEAARQPAKQKKRA